MAISSAVGLIRSRRLTRALAALIMLVLLGLPSNHSHADIFHLSGGETIEGTIVRETGDLISIRSNDGKITTIDRSRIERIEKKSTFLDEYLKRSASIKVDDLEGNFDLAKWCHEVKLASLSQKHLKLVLAIDPDHDVARTILGYVWIGGDWYIKGSPEATERREELSADPAVPVREIPEQLRLPDWDQQDLPELPELPPLDDAGVEKVVVIVDEKIGRKKPERSGMIYHLRRMGGKLQFVPGKDDKAKIIVKVRTRCYFVKLQTFFSAPIANIFQGEARAQFYERNSAGKLVLRKTTTVKIPFSSSVQRSKEVALQYTYYITLETIAARISRWGWMKQRGSRSLPMPNTR
ncbi:MAG: hypothetical protein COB10_01085 [Planctomycetota bacterium]|nr:MAG: hypothetical protein COB10_01085 [Planctomycetota bacterium]